MDKLEKTARLFCIADGRDPDKLEEVGHSGEMVPTWEGYIMDAVLLLQIDKDDLLGVLDEEGTIINHQEPQNL